MWKVIKADELYHHGIKGQKWGVRRFQNPDGTLTAAGKRRLYKGLSRENVDYRNLLSKEQKDRLTGAGKTVHKTAKASEKASDAHDKDVYDRWINQKPKNNVVSFTEDTFMEEHFRDTESRRAMLKAMQDEKAAWREFQKIGKSVSEELLGKYASKSVYNFATGKRTTAGEKLADDLRRLALADKL